MNKSISIVLDKTRNLRFDFNALCVLEEELGVSLTDLGDKLTGSLRFKDLRAIVWAGLLHEDEGLTLKDVGKLLDPSKLLEVAEAVGKAFSMAFPEPAAEDKEKDKAKN